MRKSRYGSNFPLRNDSKVHIRRLGGYGNGANDLLPLPEIDQLFLGN